MRPIICNVFIGDLGTKSSYVLMKSADDTKLGAAINREEHQNIRQEELDDLEDWSNRNRRITCSTKHKVMHPGTKKKNDCHKLGMQRVQMRKEGNFASVNQPQNACEPLKGYECQKSTCKVSLVILEMDKTITQMVEKTFFRVYSSTYMKMSLKN